MIIREFKVTLKDGRKALIRSPKEEDVQGMLDYLYQSAGETDFVLRYPEECSRYTAEGEKELFERINSSSTEAMLVCIVEGKIAGNCQITWNNRIKTRHRASVAIALLQDYWGCSECGTSERWNITERISYDSRDKKIDVHSMIVLLMRKGEKCILSPENASYCLTS